GRRRGSARPAAVPDRRGVRQRPVGADVRGRLRRRAGPVARRPRRPPGRRARRLTRTLITLARAYQPLSLQGCPMPMQQLPTAKEGMTLGEYAAAAWRHKLLVLAGLAAGPAAVIVAYAQRTPVYESTAQVLVVKKPPAAVGRGQGQAQDVPSDDDLFTQ